MVFSPPHNTPSFTLGDPSCLVATDDYKKVDGIVLENMLGSGSFVAFDVEYDSTFPVSVPIDGATLHTTATRIATIQLATANCVLVVLIQNNCWFFFFFFVW